MLFVDSFSDFFGKYLTHTRVSFFTDAQEGAGNDFADAAGEWLGRVGRAAAPESVMRASSLLLYLRVVGVCSDSGELGREIACKASFEAASIVQYGIVEHVFVASLGPFFDASVLRIPFFSEVLARLLEHQSSYLGRHGAIARLFYPFEHSDHIADVSHTMRSVYEDIHGHCSGQRNVYVERHILRRGLGLSAFLEKGVAHGDHERYDG